MSTTKTAVIRAVGPDSSPAKQDFTFEISMGDVALITELSRSLEVAPNVAAARMFRWAMRVYRIRQNVQRFRKDIMDSVIGPMEGM